jgi:SOS response regulatory protein OraA/RecX
VLLHTLQDIASQLFDGDLSDDEAAAALAAARAAAGGSSSDVLQQQLPKRGLREQDYNSEDDDFIEDDLGGMYNQVCSIL